MPCATRWIRSFEVWNEHGLLSRRITRMLLSIQDLKVAFRMGKVDGVVQRFEAVKGVSFDIPENGTLALVGESGSGKSVTAMSILNLLPDNAERSGRIEYRGRDLLH